jgi:hypothetical protein
MISTPAVYYYVSRSESGTLVPQLAGPEQAGPVK